MIVSYILIIHYYYHILVRINTLSSLSNNDSIYHLVI